jgi:hypothetical protein
LLIALVALCALATPASAQRFDEPYLAAKLMLGFGGELQLEEDGTVLVDYDEADADPAYGVGLMGMNPLLGILGLGAQVSLMSWGADTPGDDPHHLFLDLSVIPQVNFSIAIIELYLNVPIGLTVNFPDDEELGGTGVEVSTGTGMHIGIMVGARLGLGGFGLLAEVGYMNRNFSHDFEGPLGDVEIDYTLEQAALNLGVYF